MTKEQRAVLALVAAVIEKDGKVLIGKRRREAGYGGRWEFPGGGIEAGETPEAAVAREIREELDVCVKVGEHLLTVDYHSPTLSAALSVYRAEIVEGEFKLNDHDEIRWAAPRELDEKVFTPPDRPVVRRLKKDAK